MLKPKFILMCELPYSGKTTLAKKMEVTEKAVRLSSDEIRKELYGDESIQGKPEEVFGILHKRAREAIKSGKSVIYDATNISRKDRRKALASIQGLDAERICYVIPLPFFVTDIRRISREENKVPKEIIHKMRERWNTPYYFEGWDKICLVPHN